MSTAHHDDAHGGADSHHDHSHDFDGEPAKELPCDETPTPSWVPLVGLAIFLSAGVYFLAASPADARDSGATAEAAAQKDEAPPPGERPARPSGAGAPSVNPGAAAS